MVRGYFPDLSFLLSLNVNYLRPPFLVAAGLAFFAGTGEGEVSLSTGFTKEFSSFVENVLEFIDWSTSTITTVLFILRRAQLQSAISVLRNHGAAVYSFISLNVDSATCVR